MKNPRILVLRGGAIGDFIVTLPALQALRERWPDAHIELLGYPHVARLAEIAGIVTHVESLDRAPVARLFATRYILDEDQERWFRSFDIILNYLHDPDGSLAENFRQTGAPLVLHHTPLVTDRHACDHFLQPLESLAIYPAARAPVLRLIPAPTEPFTAIHAGSGSAKKNWPTENYIALARALRSGERERTDQRGGECERTVFILGEADAAAEEILRRELPHAEIWKQIPLPDLAARLTNATQFIGNDSGITHLAAALGLPTLALFGPTDPAHWAPRGPRVQILRAPHNDLTRLPLQTVLAHLPA